jgi:RimJ/RimL family protein N-acetyltransferase
MKDIPTERLILRNFRSGDWKELHAYLSLPETYRFEPGSPISEDEARLMAAERSRGDTFIAVESSPEGKLLGHLYFNLTEPAKFRTWELGYIFNPLYQGRGYCTEACRAIISHAFSALDAHRIVAFCDPLNPASWKVLERLGMRREGEFKQKAFFRSDASGAPLWHDCWAYGILEGDRP